MALALAALALAALTLAALTLALTLAVTRALALAIAYRLGRLTLRCRLTPAAPLPLVSGSGPAH